MGLLRCCRDQERTYTDSSNWYILDAHSIYLNDVQVLQIVPARFW